MYKQAISGVSVSLLALVCGSAAAQSSVTIYGIIDAGFTYIDNEAGTTKKKLVDGANYGNRLGFRGTEDLGGGMSAIFQLEQGFNLKTGTLGQGGRSFGRQAYVGLQGPWGTISAGRQFDAIRDYFQQFNYGGYASVYAGHQGDFDRVSGKQFDNSFRYASPRFGGFSFTSLYAFGEQADSFKKNSSFSLGAGYKNGPFSVGGAYIAMHNMVVYPYLQTGVFSFLGKTAATRNASTGAVTDLFAAAAGGFKVDKQTITAAGASYTVGDWSFTLNGSATKFEVPTASTTMKVGEAGFMYTISPLVTLIGGYQYAKMAADDWNQYTIGARYYLSKRTWLYGNVSVLKSSDNVDASQGAGFYTIPSYGTSQNTARVAMVHTF